MSAAILDGRDKEMVKNLSEVTGDGSPNWREHLINLTSKPSDLKDFTSGRYKINDVETMDSDDRGTFLA